MAMITDRIRHASFADKRRAVLHRSLRAVVGSAIGDIAATLLVWLERARQRRQLLALSDRELQDFGSNLADASREGEKPFWRA